MQRITRALAIAVWMMLPLPANGQMVQIYGRLYPEVVFTWMTVELADGISRR